MMADIRLNYKQYLFITIGSFIGISMVFRLAMFDGQFNTGDYLAYFILGLLGLAAYIGSSFPFFSNKIKAGNYLMIPASNFEKVLSQFLIYVVAGSILYFLFFKIGADISRTVRIFHTTITIDGVTLPGIDKLDYSYFWNNTPKFERWLVLLLFTAIGLFAFSVRLFFKKYAFLKTVIVFAVIILGIICLLFFLSHVFFPEHVKGFDIYMPDLSNQGLNEKTLTVCGIIFFSLIIILELLLAYFKFQEKQA